MLLIHDMNESAENESGIVPARSTTFTKWPMKLDIVASFSTGQSVSITDRHAGME